MAWFAATNNEARITARAVIRLGLRCDRSADA